MNARARQHLTTESGGYLIAITSLAASACVYCMGSTASAAEQARDAKGNIEEVIVTAQKRAERLQDVPISIAVLGGEGLDKSTVEGVTEALKRVPGVTNTVGVNGGTQLAVRGVSAGGPLFSGSSPVAYYLDSVPFGFVKTAIVPDSNAYDVERVEILRGPQGTLYGASAQNGVVRVLTRDANPDAFELKTRTSVSTTDGGGDNYRVDAALNVPLVEDKLAARAVVGYQDMDGWVDAPNRDDVNDAKLVSYRLKVNARPTENLSIGLSAWRSDNDYGAPSTSDDQGRVASVHDQSIATDYDVYGLKIAYDFAGIRLTSSTSYLDYQNIYDLDFFLPTLLTTELDSKVKAEELILNSTQGETWRWSLGGFYRDAEDRLVQTWPGLLPSPLDWSETSKSFAFFGEITRVLLDGRFEVTAGLRHFEDDVEGRENSSLTGDPNAPLNHSKSNFDATSPRLVLTWHPNADVTSYVSYAEGFRSGFNQNPLVLTVAPAFPPLTADTLKNYEMGLKTGLFDGRLAIDSAVYFMDWQDVQQPLTVDFNGAPVAAIINGASASGLGVDLGISTEVIGGLRIGATVSWNDLTMDSDVFSQEPSGPVLLFHEGDRLSYSAEYTTSLSVDYAFPLGKNGMQGRFSTSATYSSEQAYRTIVGGTLIVDEGDPMLISRASFSIDFPRRWSATLFADNINNEDGAYVGFLNVPDWASRTRPRTIGLQLEYQF
jgi:iron complex outermembrane recepter protein